MMKNVFVAPCSTDYAPGSIQLVPPCGSNWQSPLQTANRQLLGRGALFIIMLLFCTFTTLYSKGQGNQWIIGEWNGVYFGEKSKITKTFDTRLQITKVNGAQFEGVVQCILPSDTTVRLHTRVTGRVYSNYIMTKLKDVVYFKDPPGQYTWAKNCNACDSMKYSFEMKEDSILLQGERRCDTLCSIVARYAKSIESLKYKAAFLYEHDLTARMPVKTAGTSIHLFRPIAGDSLKPRNFLAGRAVNPPTRYIINADSAELRLMDNGIVDGDTISIFYNGQLIVQRLGLKEKPFTIKLPIFKGYPNHLVVYAESLGTYPPNTALIQVSYGKKEESFLLSSNLSKSGSIELVNNSN
jgi:hypothetical protein